jgi:hypothetical protein
MDLLYSSLQLTFPTFVLTRGENVALNPTLTVTADATPATTEENAFIRIIPKTYAGFPTISLASTDDGRGHLIQIVIEMLGAPDTDKAVWSSIDFTQLIARLKELSVDVELYGVALGSVPVEGDIIAGNFLGAIVSNVRHPNIGQ